MNGKDVRAAQTAAKEALLTAQRLREVLNYDQHTGAFTWTQATRVGKRLAGKLVGYRQRDGYWWIGVDGSDYAAHRLAWLYVTGAWPVDQIDHINTIRDDNRFCNLREATGSVNAQNQRKPNKNGKSGFLGVTWHKASKRWQAAIKVGAKTHHLGLFETPDHAYSAYLTAKRSLHEGCTI